MGTFLFVLIVLLGAAAAFLALRLLLLHRALGEMNRELQDITDKVEENRILKLPVPDGSLEELMVTINGNLQELRKEHLAYQEKERKLKEQIEHISHDLRTPLTAIIGYLKILDEEKLDREEREYLAIAIKKAYTLSHLIEQFYELSKVTAEDFQIRTEKTDAARILRECVLEQYALFEKEEKRLELESPDTPVMLFGDSEALERIFTNLLQNGIRYAKEELQITFRLEESECRSAVFFFKNEIEEAQKADNPEKLFERFYMQERARSRGGSGLGLTISRYLTERMGGTLTAEYTKENGKDYLVLEVRLVLAEKNFFHTDN